MIDGIHHDLEKPVVIAKAFGRRDIREKGVVRNFEMSKEIPAA